LPSWVTRQTKAGAFAYSYESAKVRQRPIRTG
jgi:hypothetical protein